MARRLKFDMPGPDRRVDPGEVREKGWGPIFGLEVAPRLAVDIGFGRGEFLMDQAREHPERAHVGIDYSFRRTLKMARRIARTEIENLRLLEVRAEEAVRDLFPPGSVEVFWINFPDPWPKTRHHRRRLIGAGFVRRLAECLVPWGEVQVSTDHAGYAEVIDAALAGEPLLENALAPRRFARHSTGHRATAYELEWRAQGRSLHFWTYRRQDSPEAD